MICTPTTTTHAAILGRTLVHSATATFTSVLTRRKRVLIADDDNILLKALSMKLRHNGYEVITTLSGANTVGLARSTRPDIILLDINFPDDAVEANGAVCDGLVIMDWLRQMEETKSTPVIIMTGEDPTRYRTQSLAAGAVAFFHKPIRPDELLPVIRRALGEDPAGAS